MLWSTHRIRLYEELHGDNNQKSLFRNTDSTITFGTSSAPFLARLHEETADDNQELLPRATQVLYSDFFVGLFSGVSAVEEAVHLQWDVSALLQTAGFTQRKWASNHPHFWMPFWRNFKRHLCYCSIIGKGWSLSVCCEILILTNFRFRAASLTRLHQISLQLQNIRCYPLLHRFSVCLAHKAQLSVSNFSYNSCVKIN